MCIYNVIFINCSPYICTYLDFVFFLIESFHIPSILPNTLFFNVGYACECDFKTAHTNSSPAIRVHPRRPLECQPRSESTTFQKRTINCLFIHMHLNFIYFMFYIFIPRSYLQLLGFIRCQIEVGVAIPSVMQYHSDVWKAGYRNK